jgi:hypothetical protein
MLTRTEVLRIECLLHSAHVSERWHSLQRLQVVRLLKSCRDAAGDTSQQRILLLELWSVLGSDWSHIPEPEQAAPILFDD